MPDEQTAADLSQTSSTVRQPQLVAYNTGERAASQISRQKAE